MVLEPGPLPPLSGALSPDFATEATGFGELTRAALAELPQIESDMGDSIDTVSQLVGSDPSQSILDILSPADAELPNHTIESYVGDPGDLPAASTYSDERLSNAWPLT